MHSEPMKDSDGEFSKYKPAPGVECRKCKKVAVEYSTWESNCGGYEDYHYKRLACGHTWWVDGIDS